MNGDDERSARQGDARNRLRRGESTEAAGTTEAAARQADEASSLTLGELTEAAGVSVRTVRYYIAEGLLPPPRGAGPQSAYARGHLDRLRLIQRLKAAYLPLKEIRRRLAGLDDAEVRRLLAAEAGSGGEEAARLDGFAVMPPPEWNAEADPMADARDYLAVMERRVPYRTAPLDLPFDALQQEAAPAPVHDGAFRAPRLSRAAAARGPAEPEPAVEPAPEPVAMAQGLWRRIALGEEAELVISDRIYQRHRERIDWLVRWARKVFA